MTWHWVDIAVFASGVVIGALIKWGYLRVKGIRVRVPYVDRSDASIGIAVVVITVLSLVTIVQTQINADQAEECNRQFRAALTYNTGLTAEQRELTNRANTISAQRRELLDHTFIDIGDAIGEPDRIRQIVVSYNRDARTLSAEYEQLINDRTRLDQVRKPYPDPECGR